MLKASASFSILASFRTKRKRDRPAGRSVQLEFEYLLKRDEMRVFLIAAANMIRNNYGDGGEARRGGHRLVARSVGNLFGWPRQLKQLVFRSSASANTSFLSPKN